MALCTREYEYLFSRVQKRPFFTRLCIVPSSYPKPIQILPLFSLSDWKNKKAHIAADFFRLVSSVLPYFERRS